MRLSSHHTILNHAPRLSVTQSGLMVRRAHADGAHRDGANAAGVNGAGANMDGTRGEGMRGGNAD